MILYLTLPKILKIINSFGKVAGYKINIQKRSAFIYTNNEQTEKEIRESILYTIASKIIRYLRINLMKETKDLYLRINLMKETKDLYNEDL
jgi:hypothetical protein